mmetsp:Transcript_59053/g.126924  ORF Transcript_59053/g.126924 Transcript_59053/m.126924 type:complete len:366 (-) Transcript_59053:2101-3198(-)
MQLLPRQDTVAVDVDGVEDLKNLGRHQAQGLQLLAHALLREVVLHLLAGELAVLVAIGRNEDLAHVVDATQHLAARLAQAEEGCNDVLGTDALRLRRMVGVQGDGVHRGPEVVDVLRRHPEAFELVDDHRHPEDLVELLSAEETGIVRIAFLEDLVQECCDPLQPSQRLPHPLETFDKFVQRHRPRFVSIDPEEEELEVLDLEAELLKLLLRLRLAEAFEELLAGKLTAAVPVRLFEDLGDEHGKLVQLRVAWLRPARGSGCGLEGMHRGRNALLYEFLEAVLEARQVDSPAETDYSADGHEELIPVQLHVPKGRELVDPKFPSEGEGNPKELGGQTPIRGLASQEELDPCSVGHDLVHVAAVVA